MFKRSCFAMYTLIILVYWYLTSHLPTLGTKFKIKNEDLKLYNNSNDKQLNTRPVPSWISHLCPHHHTKNEFEFTEVMPWSNPNENDIFFTQTSCARTLTPREACAVESTKKHNPGQRILVLMTSPMLNSSEYITQVLVKLENVVFMWLDLDKLFQPSRLQKWHVNREWMLNPERMSIFMSDAVRTVLLANYGGTYVDLDAISLRPFPSTNNWVAKLTNYEITAAVSSFVKSNKFMKEVEYIISQEFNPESCCSIGPYLVTKLLNQQCQQNLSLSDEIPDHTHEILCNGVTIFPNNLFYPIHYGYKKGELEQIFTTGKGYGPKFITNSNAISLHLYASLSHMHQMKLGGDSVLEFVMKKNCPIIYNVLHRKNLLF